MAFHIKRQHLKSRKLTVNVIRPLPVCGHRNKRFRDKTKGLACLTLNAAFFLQVFGLLQCFPACLVVSYLTNALTETLPLSLPNIYCKVFFIRPVSCNVSSFTTTLLSNQESVQRPPHAHSRQAERGGGEQVAGLSAGSAQHAWTPQEPGRR